MRFTRKCVKPVQAGKCDVTWSWCKRSHSKRMSATKETPYANRPQWKKRYRRALPFDEVLQRHRKAYEEGMRFTCGFKEARTRGLCVGNLRHTCRPPKTGHKSRGRDPIPLFYPIPLFSSCLSLVPRTIPLPILRSEFSSSSSSSH